MANNNQESKQLKNAANAFFKAVKNNASDKDFADLLAKNPKLLESEEFVDRMFPNQKNTQKGLVSLDKMMATLSKVKELAEKGVISNDQLESFLQSKHSQTGETFATCAAQQAEAAKEKANHENPSLSEDGKNKLLNNQQKYEDCLGKMEEMGVPLDLTNKKGKSANDIYARSNSKDSAQTENSNSADALHVSVENNGDSLEVGGEGKTPLKVNVAEKPVKVNVAKKENEDENEATVEEAPEEEKPKKGDYKGDKIGERDIIDYMYNEWFLASVDWAINGAVGWAVNGVENLCDRGNKQMNKSSSNKAAKQKGKVNKFQNNGRYLLGNAVTNLKNEYATSKDQRLAAWKDISANLGKTPQKWTALDPKNPQDKQFIDMVNNEYKANPQACVDKVDKTIQNHTQHEQINAAIFGLAAEIASAKIAYESMEQGSLARLTKGEKNLGALSADKIDKKLQKETLQQVVEIQKTLEATNLSIEMQAAKEGITDKNVIMDRQQKFTAAYLTQLAQQTMDCKTKLSGDLAKGDFNYAKSSMAKETVDSFKDMMKLENMEKLSDKILDKSYQKIISQTLEAEAKARFSPSSLDGMSQNLSQQQAANQYAQEKNQARKDFLNNWKTNGNKGLDNVLSNGNHVFTKLLNKTQGRE